MELSLLEDNVKNRIRTQLLAGKSIKEIQEEMGIPTGTWDSAFWKDTHGFRTFVKDCQDEKLRDIARRNILEAIEMPIPNSDDPRWHKIKTDTSQFILETLEKDRYSKKTEENKDQRTPINIQLNTYERIKKLKKG